MIKLLSIYKYVGLKNYGIIITKLLLFSAKKIMNLFIFSTTKVIHKLFYLDQKIIFKLLALSKTK